MTHRLSELSCAQPLTVVDVMPSTKGTGGRLGGRTLVVVDTAALAGLAKPAP